MSVDICRNVERIRLPSLASAEATTAAMSFNLSSVWSLSGITCDVANMEQLYLPLFMRNGVAIMTS